MTCTAAIWLAFTALFLASTNGTPDIRLPPTIVVHPAKFNIYLPDDDVLLECRATGTPPPSYWWTKDGVTLNENVEKIRRLTDGIIKITGASSSDEGNYQCFARNPYGIAMSMMSNQRRAVLPGIDKTIRQVTVKLGQPFNITRIKDRYYPKPSFEWETGLEFDRAPVRLQTDSRVQINSENGDLHFAYAVREDQLSNDQIYKCSVINPHLDIRAGSSYTKVIVLDDPNGPQPFPPRIGFRTESPYIALEGQNISLRCFYNGNPAPNITWRKIGGNFQAGRITLLNSNTELIIRNAEPRDEGYYECMGLNSQGSQETVIHVDVQAAPSFRETANVPRDLNLTIGDSVMLSCGTHAEPEAQTHWFKNGKQLDPNNLPERFRMSNNNRNLTISEVCSECGDVRPDLQVIQCNSSNEHGYEFAAGYINVLNMCHKPVDVVIGIDQSYSLSKVGLQDTFWQRSLTYAAKIVEGFLVSPDAARIGVAELSDQLAVAFHLDAFNDTSDVIEAIEGLGRDDRLATFRLETLSLVASQMFVRARPGVHRVFIGILGPNAFSQTDNSIYDELSKLKEANISTYLLFMTNVSTSTILNQLSGAFVRFLPDNDKMIDVTPTLLNRICAGASVRGTTTPTSVLQNSYDLPSATDVNMLGIAISGFACGVLIFLVIASVVKFRKKCQSHPKGNAYGAYDDIANSKPTYHQELKERKASDQTDEVYDEIADSNRYVELQGTDIAAADIPATYDHIDVKAYQTPDPTTSHYETAHSVEPETSTQQDRSSVSYDDVGCTNFSHPLADTTDEPHSGKTGQETGANNRNIDNYLTLIYSSDDDVPQTDNIDIKGDHITRV